MTVGGYFAIGVIVVICGGCYAAAKWSDRNAERQSAARWRIIQQARADERRRATAIVPVDQVDYYAAVGTFDAEAWLRQIDRQRGQ